MSDREKRLEAAIADAAQRLEKISGDIDYHETEGLRPARIIEDVDNLRAELLALLAEGKTPDEKPTPLP